MTNNTKERVRKVDVEKMSGDQAESVGLEIGNKIKDIGDEAAAKINAIVQIYGIKAKIAVQLIDIQTGEIIE